MPDARAFGGPCPGPAEVRSDLDGPGLSGFIANLQDSYGVIRFDEGKAQVIDARFISKLRNNAYASWSVGGLAAASYYGGRTGIGGIVTTGVALVPAPARAQDIVDPHSLEYNEVIDDADVGDIAVFHHDASDSFLALRLEQVTALDDRPDCATDGGRNPVATGNFSFYLLDGGTDGFAGFGRP